MHANRLSRIELSVSPSLIPISLFRMQLITGYVNLSYFS
jgi:hypothetical protein